MDDMGLGVSHVYSTYLEEMTVTLPFCLPILSRNIRVNHSWFSNCPLAFVEKTHNII